MCTRVKRGRRSPTALAEGKKEKNLHFCLKLFGTDVEVVGLFCQKTLISILSLKNVIVIFFSFVHFVSLTADSGGQGQRSVAVTFIDKQQSLQGRAGEFKYCQVSAFPLCHKQNPVDFLLA